MAKDNIYDLIISELILRAGSETTNSDSPNLELNSSIGTDVHVNFNGSSIFTSKVNNIPTGYSIAPNSHVIAYPLSISDTVGSSVTVVGGSIPVILGSFGNTFTVTSTVILIHPTLPLITLVGSVTITSQLPIYYGVKPLTGFLDTTGLSMIPYTLSEFTLTSSVHGRLFIVVPSSIDPIMSVLDHNGLVYDVQNNFDVITVGSMKYYITKNETQMTGSNVKKFTIKYL